ncbi:TPA: UvrD-helicase domain-containing protein [Pasteurella multocida]
MDNVDNEIYSYATGTNKKSFLLFAGAGSGKTRTLVNVLERIKESHKAKFVRYGQKVKVITFTNAACEEIKHRLRYDSTFNVSTIHSFSWELIKPFTQDIKNFLKKKLSNDIDELKTKVDKARSEKSRENYQKDLIKKQDRLSGLDTLTDFIYSPTEILVGKGTLNHSEVISICASFLKEYSLMQNILISQYPILFIDECQDTQKELLISLISVQQSRSNEFCLGLFGDLTQQIYMNGYSELADNLPDDWEKPYKQNNYRCASRIVDLINNIGKFHNREFLIQCAKKEDMGFVRLFILKNNIENKLEKEKSIREEMALLSSDSDWNNIENVKTLVLEHAMAAKRSGFNEFFLPLSKNNIIKDNLLQQTGTCAQFILGQFLPLIESIQNNNLFNIMRILEKYSPRMKDKIEINLDSIRNDIDELTNLVSDDNTIEDILYHIYNKDILEIPDDIKNGLNFEKGNYEEDDKEFLWNQALKASLIQLKQYGLYINGKLGFDTHQGVKGLEFPRVMAILDDEESNGFLFKYSKLFGTTPLSATDIKNMNDNKDYVVSRTSRLFYVICSRAEESLAVVVYSNNTQALKEKVLELNWFNEDEIDILE